MNQTTMNQTNPIQIDTDSDSDSDSSLFPPATTHKTTHHNRSNNNNSSRRSSRMHTREIRHMAHCILSSKELLLLHAVASNESVPRMRRRFMAQVLEPDDPERALGVALASTAGTARPTTTARGVAGGSGAIGAIQGTLGNGKGNLVVDVIETDDRMGWELYTSTSTSTPRSGKKPYNVNSAGRKRSAGSRTSSRIRFSSEEISGRDDDVEMEDI